MKWSGLHRLEDPAVSFEGLALQPPAWLFHLHLAGALPHV